MADTSINIGDYCCRASRSRHVEGMRRSESRSRGMMLVPMEARRERESLRLALVGENPPVFDIAIAREATRLRQSMVVRPIPITRRRAQIIRISEPRVVMMGVAPRVDHDRRLAMSDDYDLPPAA